MAKKPPRMNTDQSSEPPLSSTVQDSAQQIWLAGLGAFAKAQQQGGKVFETLVKEGLALQRKTQAAAEEKIAEANSRLNAIASGIQVDMAHRTDKLETIFEDRVAKALTRLGMPSATEINALVAHVEQLNQYMQQLHVASAAAATSTVPCAPALPTSPPVPTAAQKAARPAVTEKTAKPRALKSARTAGIAATDTAATQRARRPPSS
ncbi:MAG: phasin family protein [Pseudomonadota bacterium]|nr:phasin family protein [Pseudomonadota bacterium]